MMVVFGFYNSNGVVGVKVQNVICLLRVTTGYKISSQIDLAVSKLNGSLRSNLIIPPAIN